MDEQNILDMETGEKEFETLKPATVKIEKIEIQEVGEKKNKKLVCSVKHPEKEELISISAVKYENKGKLETVGLWVNLDEDKKIRKGSALAVLIAFLNAGTPNGLVGKDVATVEGDKKYLAFKGY